MAGIIALVAALLAGILVFAFVEFRSDGHKTRVEVGGIRRAEAACTDAAPRCLPQITMRDTAGHSYPPESLAGKVVVVNVWATWCHPCESEIPDFVKVADRYRGKGVVLVGLLNDSVPDARLDAFVEEHGMTYPIIRMSDALYEAFDHPDRLPTTFVYDRSGHLQFDSPGAMDEDELSQLLDQLLAR
jgi:thiol-disulfide isomerase/thioredoxin